MIHPAQQYLGFFLLYSCLSNIQTEVQPLLIPRDNSSLAVSTSALALVVQDEHSQGRGSPGRPALLSVPKTYTGAKRKSGRCELAVSLIYLTFLNWWGSTTLERIGQTRLREWLYHFEECWFGTSWYSLSQGMSGKALEVKTAVPEGCGREGS